MKVTASTLAARMMIDEFQEEFDLTPMEFTVTPPAGNTPQLMLMGVGS